MAIEGASAGQTGVGDEPERLVAGIHHPVGSAGQGALKSRPLGQVGQRLTLIRPRVESAVLGPRKRSCCSRLDQRCHLQAPTESQRVLPCQPAILRISRLSAHSLANCMAARSFSMKVGTIVSHAMRRLNPLFSNGWRITDELATPPIAQTQGQRAVGLCRAASPRSPAPAPGDAGRAPRRTQPGWSRERSGRLSRAGRRHRSGWRSAPSVSTWNSA